MGGRRVGKRREIRKEKVGLRTEEEGGREEGSGRMVGTESERRWAEGGGGREWGWVEEEG